jgi:two-component system, response regulator YesN
MLNILDFVTNSAIENFRKAFFDATGMLLSFADNEHKQYNMFYAGSRCEFCKIMNSTNKGLEACIGTSRIAGKEAARNKKAHIYKCHAGISEVVVPIVVNGQHIGSVFSGQVATVQPGAADYEAIRDHMLEIGVYSDELMELYGRIPVVSESKLEIVAELLTIAVDFMTETEENNLLKEQILKEKEKFNQIIPYIKNELLNYVMYNNTEKLAEAQEIFELIGLKNIPNFALVLRLDGYEELAKNQGNKFKMWISNKTIEILNNELERIKDNLILPIDDGKFIILSGVNKNLTAEKKRTACLAIAEKLRNAVEYQMPCSATVGIGRYYDGTINLGKSYMEANNAQMYGLVVGRNQVIHIDDIMFEAEEHTYHFIEYNKLKDIIILANKEKVNAIVNEAFNQFVVFGEKDLNKIKAFGMEFLSQILNAAVESGLNSDYVTKKIEYFRQLDGLNNVQEIYDWENSIVDSIMNSIISNRNSRDSMIVERAKKFIESCYDKDVSLEDVALNVYLSPNYFGWLFKKETKMTYVEYLTQFRMEKAKNLLATTSLSIQSISEKVGYNDPNYFSQVYKKYFGIRPSASRNQTKK